jgi:serine/threonine protein kinase
MGSEGVLQVLGAIAHYNLLEHIGEGGLGEVYRARDTKVGRTVALKLTPPGLAVGQRYHRLLDDARAAARLSHPNIATLFDIGEHDGRLYLGYEFVQGKTLRQQMNAAPMNPRHALDLAIQVADAMSEAHSHGVLHKDLRPETILETGKGSAKILDFGLAVWTRGGQTRALAAAAPGSVGPDAALVVAYMSPEQAAGAAVDARTDVFSLAVIVYEMVTGRHPFAGPDAASVLNNITQKAVPPPSSLNPELPKMLDVVLSRALAKPVDRRTESAARLTADLRRARGVLEPRETEPHAPARRGSSERRNDVFPIEEERGGASLWWLLASLGAGIAAALYYWLR